MNPRVPVNIPAVSPDGHGHGSTDDKQHPSWRRRAHPPVAWASRVFRRPVPPACGAGPRFLDRGPDSAIA